jgi:hypothetical protein
MRHGIKVKVCQIRTELVGKSKDLSEPDRHSDRVGGKKRRRVRNRASFGQSGWEEAKACPNQSVIRTELVDKSEGVSETKHHSDRVGG